MNSSGVTRFLAFGVSCSDISPILAECLRFGGGCVSDSRDTVAGRKSQTSVPT